jgi:alpha-glucan,water dikinase
MKIKNINDKNNALKIKSVLSRLSILLSNIIDYYNNVYDNRVKYLGKELNIDNFYCNVFTEELIRGSMFFILSILIKKIEPSIRKNAELNDWLIISRGKIKDNYGKLFYIKNLHDVQFEKYKEKNIIVTEVINGEEEIPFNCEGLIIIKNENYPDILSHVSVRARNLNIPFIVCFNEDISNTICKLVGNYVNVKIINQNCEVIKTEHIENIENDNKNDKNIIKLNLKDVGEKYEKIYLEIDEFTNNNVGAKSLNTKKIYNKIELCPWLKFQKVFLFLLILWNLLLI